MSIIKDIKPYKDNPNIMPPITKTIFCVVLDFLLHFLHPVTCVASVFKFDSSIVFFNNYKYNGLTYKHKITIFN